MHWLRRNRLDIATAASVVLTALVGILSNIVVGSWGWALLTSLLVLVVCLAGVEMVRHRASQHKLAQAPQQTTPSAAPTGVTITTGALGRVQFAGRDAYQIKIGTGGVFAVLGILALALLVGGGSIYLGSTPAAIPHPIFGQQPASSTPSALPTSVMPTRTRTAAAAYHSSLAVGTSGVDLDPPSSSNKLADISFDSTQGGLSFLNGASVATVPDGASYDQSQCQTLRYTSASIPQPRAGLTLCLHTSDGRYGTVSITSAKADVLGGIATVTWTIWQ